VPTSVDNPLRRARGQVLKIFVALETRFSRIVRRLPMNELHLVSPFHFYNLRRNPFGELTRHERTELAIVEVADWLTFLKNTRAVLQLLGDCGRGKTTHALALLHAMPAAEYIYLPEEKPRPQVGLQRPMIIDESQRLTFWQLRRVLRVPGALVLCTHVDHRRAIQRAGRELHSVEIGTDTTPSKLQNILNRRLEASRLGDGTIPQITQDHATQLHSRFGSDVRAIEHHLYIEFQNTALKQQSWPPAT
jgi:hypothetical protein